MYRLIKISTSLNLRYYSPAEYFTIKLDIQTWVINKQHNLRLSSGKHKPFTIDVSEKND